MASVPQRTGGHQDKQASVALPLKRRRNRAKIKGRRVSGQFVMLPLAVIERFHGLSPAAVKLLIELFSQYNGRNNGDFTVAWSVMRRKGWRSQTTMHKALWELRCAGFVAQTRQGDKHKCSLYAVTWLRIDECGGKLDIQSSQVPLGWWRTGVPHDLAPTKRAPIKRCA